LRLLNRFGHGNPIPPAKIFVSVFSQPDRLQVSIQASEHAILSKQRCERQWRYALNEAGEMHELIPILWEWWAKDFHLQYCSPTENSEYWNMAIWAR